MTLTRSEKDYVAGLVAFLRSDRHLDHPSPLSGPVSLTWRYGMGAEGELFEPGLFRWERDAIADIVEYFFRRKDGKKQGRPPHTMLEKWNDCARLLKYHRLVFFELNDGKSYAEAIKNVASRNGLSPSSLKRYLRGLKVEKYTDEERALLFTESNERFQTESDQQFQYVCLVQDEINAGKTYDEAVRIVARRKRIDPSELKRITKPYFGG
jgi:hypothetical protein